MDNSFREKVTSTVDAIVNLEECEMIEFVAVELPPGDTGEDGNATNVEAESGGGEY